MKRGPEKIPPAVPPAVGGLHHVAMRSVKALFKEVGAGCVTGAEMVVDAASLAALFAGAIGDNGVDDIDTPLKAALVSLFVHQFLLSAFSQLNPHVVAVGWEAVPLLLAMVDKIFNTELDGDSAFLDEQMAAGATEAQAQLVLVAKKNATGCIALLLMNALAGAVMLVLGQARLAGMVSFIPETTLIGIFGCIGYQLFTLGFDLSTDGDSAFDLVHVGGSSTWEALGEERNWPRWLVGLSLGLLLFAGSKKLPERFGSLLIPGYYGAFLVLFHVIFAGMGWSLSKSAEEGWSFRHFATGHIWDTYDTLFSNLSDFDGDLLMSVLPDIIMIAIIGPVLNTAVNLPLLSLKLKKKADTDFEFKLGGMGHVLTGGLFGYSAYISVSNTCEHRMNGGTTRLSTFVCVGMYASFLLFHWLLGVTNVMVNPMLGGIYFFMGIDELVNDYGMDTLRRLSKMEYGVMIVMLVVFVATGMNMLAPFLIGIAYAVFALVLQSAKSRIILAQGTLAELPPAIAFSSREGLWLGVHHQSTYVLQLCGVIGFHQTKAVGKAFQVVFDLQADTAPRPKLRRCIIDAEHVESFDNSAAMGFIGLCDSLVADHGLKIVYISGLVEGSSLTQVLRRHAEAQLADGTIKAVGSFQAAVQDIHSHNAPFYFPAPFKPGSVGARLPLLAAMLHWIHLNRPTSRCGALLHFLFSGQCRLLRYPNGAKLHADEAGVWLLLEGEAVGVKSQAISQEPVAAVEPLPPPPTAKVVRLQSSARRIVQALSRRAPSSSADAPTPPPGSTTRVRRVPTISYRRGTIVGAAGVLGQGPGGGGGADEVYAQADVSSLFISTANIAAMRLAARDSPQLRDATDLLHELCLRQLSALLRASMVAQLKHRRQVAEFDPSPARESQAEMKLKV